MSDLTMQSANALQIGKQSGIQIGTQPGGRNLAALRTAQTQSTSNTAPVPPPRLVKAAHEFEASMMKELLAPMQSGKDVLGGDDDSDNSNSALTEFASEALGKAISERGGLGIATSILRQLSASNHSKSAPVTAADAATAPNSPRK
jgi:Rod binding domain-containing protein